MRGGGHHFDSDEIAGKNFDWRYLTRLLKYAVPHRKLIIIAFVFMLVTSSAQLLVPYVFKTGIDKYIAKLYEVYTFDVKKIDLLYENTSAKFTNNFIRLSDNQVAVRASDKKKMVSVASTFFDKSSLNPTNFFIFSTNSYTGKVGYTLDGKWLVPEENLDKIPKEILKSMRPGDLDGIYFLSMVLLGLVFIRMFAEYLHTFAITLAGQRSMYDLRISAFKHMQKLSLSYYTRNPIGRLVARVTNDIQAINEVIASLLINLCRDFLIFIGAIIIIFMMNAKLALIALSLLPVLVIAVFIFKPRMRKISRRIRLNVAKLNATLTEDISGIKIVQLFNQQRKRLAEFDLLNVECYDSKIAQMIIMGIFNPLIDMLRTLGTALILVFGGFCVLKGSLTLGALVAFFAYLRELYNPIVSASQQITALQGALAGAERIFKLMDEVPEVDEHPNYCTIENPKGVVELQNVNFSYLEDTPVLNDISFTVEEGKSVAIVGSTGSGKSSIINLICRFYDPQSGSVKIDGVDVRNWSFDQLSENISIVLQDAFIFSRDIKSNIRLGCTDIDQEKLMQAAEMVQAQDFIEKLPDGFDEVMAERGATLSSGQKQLLCFARALAHDPKVLILDEATSNVDPATEQLIQKAIDTLMVGRTSIIVAHRLSTIEKVDQILVMDQGRILERGTHLELLAKKGIYYNMYLLQFSHNV